VSDFVGRLLTVNGADGSIWSLGLITCDCRGGGDASNAADEDGTEVCGKTRERHKRPEELNGGEFAGTRLGFSGSDERISFDGG
jgi:hypothetical protein